MEDAYERLTKRVHESGAYTRAYGFYALLIVGIILGIGGSLYTITLSINPLVQALNAVFLALCLFQAGILGHDLSHGQVFVSRERNRFYSKLVWGLLVGMSESGWYEHHSTHHKHVNQLEYDPDVTKLPILFEAIQIPYFSHFKRKYLVPRQHILYLLLVMPMYYTLTTFETFHIPTKRNWFEYIFVVIHYVVLFYFLLTYLPISAILVFMTVHVLVAGYLMGAGFAPNHKGRPLFSAREAITWKHQILATRNLDHTPVLFFMFGGLIFQIEHHLFPEIDRVGLSKVQPLVKEFCLENDLLYESVPWHISMKEVYNSVRQGSLITRNTPPSTTH